MKTLLRFVLVLLPMVTLSCWYSYCEKETVEIDIGAKTIHTHFQGIFPLLDTISDSTVTMAWNQLVDFIAQSNAKIDTLKPHYFMDCSTALYLDSARKLCADLHDVK
jgi:hypothetical protein